MAKSNDKTVFQIGVDAASTVIHPRNHSSAVNNSILESCSFLDEFKAKVSRAYAFADAESQKALASLLDDIRFSDPISAEEAFQDETTLIELADEILCMAETGEAVPVQVVDRMKALLRIRNSACKNAK